MTRRAFLGGAMAAAGAVQALSAEAAEIPIIDTHQHLWDLEKVRLSWLDGAGPLAHNYLVSDYLEATAGLGFERSVYMEVDVEPTRAEYDREVECILGLCRQRKRFPSAAVLGGNPAAPDFRDYVAHIKRSRYVKGLRHIPKGGEPHPYDRPEFVAGVRLLGQAGLHFELCAAVSALPRSIRLVDACPDTRFILDHCGNADPKAFLPERKAAAEHDADTFRRGLEELARRKNVACKISGIVARADPGAWAPEHLAPAINCCLDTFGPDRVVFGSDWPVCTRVATLREWVLALRQIVAGRPLDERRKLFRENALRWYRL